MYDVIIIGAGVSGCAIARELTRKRRTVAVLEAGADICEGTSKANSGIVHAGYDALPGTLKARLNLRGSHMMEALSTELDFPYRKNGALVLCFREEELPELEKLCQRGIQNGVKNLRVLSRKEVFRIEPDLSREVKGALYAPESGIVCPFELTAAYAENGAANGAEFYFHEKVADIERGAKGYRVTTGTRTWEGRVVINAAGVHADEIHNMVCREKMRIIPRRGEYVLFDKSQGGLISHTIFQLPSALGKGILITKTVHGNLLMGPTAEDIPDKEGTDTSRKGLEEIRKRAGKSLNHISPGDIITSFAGLRAHGESGDFIIREQEEAPGFIDVAGIESPGLTCAPAIGEYVADLVQGIAPAEDRGEFLSVRKRIPSLREASPEQREILVQKDPAYGRIICRCEMVTEAEVREAVRRVPGATTLDGIKRRVRAGMGRCQGGFCTTYLMDILAEELHCDKGEITKSGGRSLCFRGEDLE